MRALVEGADLVIDVPAGQLLSPLLLGGLPLLTGHALARLDHRVPSPPQGIGGVPRCGHRSGVAGQATAFVSDRGTAPVAGVIPR